MTTPSRRLRKRRRQPRTEIAIAATVAGVLLLGAIHTWPTYSAAIASLLALWAVVWAARHGQRRLHAHRSRRIAPTNIHAYRTATPGQFEHQIAALCRRDGASDVQVVGGKGDLAADVLLRTPHGRRMLIQAKHYQPGNNVRSEHVQCVNGTYRDYHRCDQAAVITTSSYTRDARQFADHVGIRLYDGQDLARWANGTGRAPWQ